MLYNLLYIMSVWKLTDFSDFYLPTYVQNSGNKNQLKSSCFDYDFYDYILGYFIGKVEF